MTTANRARARDEAFAVICAPRAETFGDGVSFVRGWSTARHASTDLARQLERAGLADHFAGLRADVSVAGDGLVCVGTVDADAAQRLAVLVTRGLCAELDRILNDPPRSSAA